MHRTKLIIAWFALACSALAACTTGGSGFCEVGSGKTYSTIQACATAMVAGQTCLVFAGTYNENVTVTAGTVGNYKTLAVNGSDIVSVYGFTLNSHTKLVGNCSEPASVASCGFSIVASSPLNAPCVQVADGSTDIYITNNVMQSCGSAGNAAIVEMQGTTGVSYVYIQGNTLSYGCGTAASPNNCQGISFNGDHVLVERNDLSHLGLAILSYARFSVIRNNTFHDMNESECGAQSGNCHLDIIYAERANAVAAYLVQYQLWEGNTGNNVTGADGKGLWTAADNPGGCGTSCFNVIGRFNVLSNFGSGSAAQTSGFLNVKYYNNTMVNNSVSAHASSSTDHYRDDSSTGGAEINNLFYYPFSFPQTWGWYAYVVPTAAGTGFTAGANLAYCTGSPCGQQTQRGSTSFLFASDTPVVASNILASSDPLANYSAGNFQLSPGSQAIAAGTYLTTVASGDSGSGTSLVVNDAGFFQDGLGLNSVGVQADCISVTTVGNHVCITAVNYSTNTLILASAITRSSGDHIWLYSKSDGVRVLTGSAPDIGAFPFNPNQSAPFGTFFAGNYILDGNGGVENWWMP